MTPGFYVAVLWAVAAAPVEPVEIVAGVPAGLPTVVRVVPATQGPTPHFFGYYGVCPWDLQGKRLACLETDVGDRLVKADDVAKICLVDAAGKLSPIADTRAWNLQQGAMLHWLPTRELAFNDRRDGKLVTVLLDVETNTKRVIDRPIYAVAPDGNTAVGVDFERLRQIRPVTGYAGGPAGDQLVNRPADNGLFQIGLKTGKHGLLTSIDHCCRVGDALPEQLAGQPLWVEHPHFSPDGKRLFFILRGFDRASKRLVSRPMVIAPAGGDPAALLPWAVGGASHYDWLDSERLIVTREVRPQTWRHLIIQVKTGATRELAPDVLTRDGHCTVSPDGRWLATDTYPDEDRRQHIFLVDLRTEKAARVASFHVPPAYRGDWRCDLHPRWDRESKRVCIDSTHSGVRQVYVLELKRPGD